eukprot:scaffold58030_cov21-Tisochrysis_lutea.AAC.1
MVCPSLSGCNVSGVVCAIAYAAIKVKCRSLSNDTVIMVATAWSPHTVPLLRGIDFGGEGEHKQ